MNYVIDACSLIYLTKIELKEIVAKNLNINITKSVKDELLRDLDKFQDAKIINKNIKQKKIAIIPLKDLQGVEKKVKTNLGLGELETIKYALQQNLIPITDDLQGIRYAKSLQLSPKTSEIIMLKMLERKCINIEQFTEKFHKLALIKSLSIEVVEFFIKEAQRINEKTINKNEEDKEQKKKRKG